MYSLVLWIIFATHRNHALLQQPQFKYTTTMSRCLVWSDQWYANASIVCRGPSVSFALHILRPFERLTLSVNVSATDMSRQRKDLFTFTTQLNYCELIAGSVVHPLIMIVFRSMMRMESVNVRLIRTCPVKPVGECEETIWL